NNFQTRPIKCSGTIEKSELDIYSSAHLSLNSLVRKAKTVASEALSVHYKNKTESYWCRYVNFCKRFDVNADTPSEEHLEAFIIWLDLIGLASQAP
ncbi:13808_t:CDS:1, partial [Cetraspora pellucida]